ncbi:PREDICTED: ribosomal RNA processing protein 1 homolog [Diuraphis noxia]|uniref:ribosomal RNA processing protein 1 homolog n=1 Tax=Diuraphis noxia TaxID=143948 RepID=UPI0007639400|nr:PREDICTED: ribosomal RNA processing protein 1 homolog [Diuraphis noxia]XP_015371300.1 PREDICTED: ribosomal RNA processing protein 1 homolog [Diuraphis noxia]XP_015371301.1 PREDICTED: ribosomal RNA processing protein 1 homolog [Diuraphis noxia]
MATEASEDKVDLVAKEIELTKLLASNDPKTRSDGIKQIKQLLLKHSGDTSDAFQLNDYLIIWRGLFYFMWMSDKPLPQETATEKISNLIHSCTSYQGKILFLDAFFLTIKDDWMSISQHRIDKFMMLVRRCLRQLLFTFVNCDWNLEYMNKFSEVLYRALKSFTLSLRTHLQEIFLEELAKVSRGRVPSEALVIILDSFLHYISELNDFMLIREVTQNVFRNLLSQSPDLEMLEAKFEAWRKMGKPGKSYNDLELVEGDIADGDSNEVNDSPLDPRAGNVSVEIPRIKFNPKDVAKILNKYVTEVDCTRKCLLEITKLVKWYNRLGDGILPYKPKDLKLNSQVLKRKKKKYLSKMVKEGVKKLEMVDSKIKKSGREVNDLKSLKELNKMGEIVVERGKIGKSMWKVRKFDNVNALKENFNLNGSWTVSDETKTDDSNTVSGNDDEPPLLVPAGFNVEVSETTEKTPTKVQKKVSLTPNFKSLTVDSSLKESNSNKRKSKSPISKINDGSSKKNILKQNSPLIGTPNALNASQNNSWSVSTDNEESVSKKVKKCIESAKASPAVNASPLNDKSLAPDSGIEEKNQTDDLVMSKLKRRSDEIKINSNLNESWSVCSDEKLKLSKSKSLVSNIANEPNKKNIQKPNSPFDKISSPNIVNTSWSVSADNDGSASKKDKSNETVQVEKRVSLTSVSTPDKSSKSPKSPKSPTPEQRVLRRRTIIIPKKKPDGQNEGTPKRKAKETSVTKASQKRRKTIAGEEISMLKPEEISNKALEKVRSEAFEDGFGTPRKSSRLSIKTDSAKKRVEFQLKNNVEQEFMEYRTSLVTKPQNPHDATKQPVQGVLKLTPDANRINPFYKFTKTSAKKNSRKSII